MQAFGIDLERDCKAILGLFMKLAEELKGLEPADRRLLDCEPLAVKTIYHASSILYLFQGTHLDGIPEHPRSSFIDHASSLVLARALLETVWAFHQIFVEPSNEDERTFRYDGWMLAGFAQREQFPAMTDFAREQIEKDRVVNTRYREALQNTKAFKRLNKNDRKKALKGQLWRSRSFKVTADAFLGKKFGAATYAWLSSYQHGDALSVIQIREAKTLEVQRQAAESALLLVAISLSQMTKAYMKLWPQLELITNRYANIQMLIDLYSRFGELSGETA